VSRSPVPPYRRVAEDLKAKIRAGELLPGEQVPSMARLAEEYGIARGTARRVLVTLKDEGFVYITPGWGTFVVDSPPPAPGS
jgi:DNA-binding GntR family transcriptional regulator